MNGFQQFWDRSDGTTRDELFTAVEAYLEILGLHVGETMRKIGETSQSGEDHLDSGLSKLQKEISCISVAPVRTRCQYLNKAFLPHLEQARRSK